MDETNAVTMLNALAQSTRLQIVRFLVERGQEGAAAGEIAKAMDVISSKASFHLSTLDQAGLITSERQSRKIIYRIDLSQMGGLVSFLLNDCCGSHPDILACCPMPDGQC